MMPWEQQRDWNRLEASTQCSAAKAIMKACCQQLGIQDDAELIEVKENDRFVLSYQQDPNMPDFAKNMIKLETMMRSIMHVVIDLRLATREDKNKRAERNGRA